MTRENKLEVFSNEEFGEVRVVEIGNKPYFCASDVAKALGYKRPNDAISAHCRATVKYSIPISGKIQEVNFIPEGDVYRLIMKSKLPSAERFESWVMDEVLPEIRKTGGYIPTNEDDDEDTIMSKALVIAQRKLEERDKRIKELKPMAQIAEKRIDKKGCMSITDCTKSFGLKKGQITKWAKLHGYLHMTLQEVNKAGEKYFKVYSSDHVHNQIGVLEEGLKLIENNIDNIKMVNKVK